MTIASFTSIVLIFLLGEMLEVLIFRNSGRNWYFRFKAFGTVSTLKVALTLLIIGIFVSTFFWVPLFNNYINNIVASSQLPILLLAASLCFTLLWGWHHLRQWHGGQYILLGISIIFLITYLYLNYVYMGQNGNIPSSSTISLPNSISVSGNFNASGNRTKILGINFGSNKATLNGNYYSVSLPNQNSSYTISAEWLGNFTWQNGTVPYSKTFSISKTNSSNPVILNLTFTTPSSFIKVTGTLQTRTGTVATDINFTAINHNVKSVIGSPGAFSGGNYTVFLPNMVNYKVLMPYFAAPPGTCSEGNYSVYESAGISEISSVNWKC